MNTLDHLILGLLKDEELSGYDLGRIFQHVLKYFWEADLSQVYRALHRLHQAGWVEVEAMPGQQAVERKVYRATPAGRAALRAWLLGPADTPPMRNPWLGQLHLSDELSFEELRTQLEAQLAARRAQLAVLEGRLRAGDWETNLLQDARTTGRFPTQALSLWYGVESMRATVNWLEKALNLLPALEESRQAHQRD